jgi:MFS family permease
MVTSPFIGALSDRYGRGGVLIVGMLLAMVLIPAPIFPRHLAGVIVAMVGLGVTASFIMSPVSPAMAEAVARRGSSSYASVYGLLNLAYATGMLVGPLLGSLLVHMWGIRIALVLVGLGFGAYVLVIRGQTLSAQ